MNIQPKEWIPVSLIKIFDYFYMNFRLFALRRNNVSYLQVQVLSKPGLTSNTIVDCSSLSSYTLGGL